MLHCTKGQCLSWCFSHMAAPDMQLRPFPKAVKPKDLGSYCLIHSSSALWRLLHKKSHVRTAEVTRWLVWLFLLLLSGQVEGLKSGALYEFQVYAGSLAGVGNPSEASAPFACHAWTMAEPGSAIHTWYHTLTSFEWPAQIGFPPRENIFFPCHRH